MNRREAIAGAVGLVGSSLLPSALAAPAAEEKQGTLTLRNDDLEIAFDPRLGLPNRYTFASRHLWGETTGQAPEAILCHLSPRAYRTVRLTAGRARPSVDSIVFPFTAHDAGKPAASFTLRYVISGGGFTLALEDVEERPGYELIELALPRLVTVREQDGPAWFAEGRNGGSFVRLEQARAYRFDDSEYFGRISTELPVGMVGQGGIACVMEVTACMDGTETEIAGSTGNRDATLGTVMVHRVHGGRCYAMNDGGDPVCGNAHTPNLLVEQTSGTRFDFFTDGGGTQPWLAGAKIVRGRVPASPTDFFSDRFLYIVAGKIKTEAAPRTTFAQSRQLIEDVAALTDNAPQTVFLGGLFYDGQDTGYPSEDKINTTLGTYEELRGLIEAGKRLNANVTLNVNYDDAYKSSPIFNEAFIARRPDGALWKSRPWDGEDSYIVGMAKFMEGGWGQRRIGYTMERYRIEDSILIDAMSWFAVRNDWDPRHPASGYKDLTEGKYKIVEEFRQRGVAVTSEQLRYPFIGKLAVTMDGPEVSQCPFGGEAIPLIATVYRGAAIWGTNAGARMEPGQQLFWNTRTANWFEASSDRAKMAEFYYLIVLPYGKLHGLAVEDYARDGLKRHIFLENNSEIILNDADNSYRALRNGVEIASDDATTCPIDDRRIAFYSRRARQLKYPLPSGWDAKAIAARALSLHGRAPHPFRVEDGAIVVDAEAGVPVIVYAGASGL